MSRPKSPAIQPLPPDPNIALEAEQRRAEAAATAVAESKAAGRRSTIVGGAKIAYEEQAGRGLLSMQRRRQAAQELGL